MSQEAVIVESQISETDKRIIGIRRSPRISSMSPNKDGRASSSSSDGPSTTRLSSPRRGRSTPRSRSQANLYRNNDDTLVDSRTRQAQVLEEMSADLLDGIPRSVLGSESDGILADTPLRFALPQSNAPRAGPGGGILRTLTPLLSSNSNAPSGEATVMAVRRPRRGRTLNKLPTATTASPMGHRDSTIFLSEAGQAEATTATPSFIYRIGRAVWGVIFGMGMFAWTMVVVLLGTPVLSIWQIVQTGFGSIVSLFTKRGDPDEDVENIVDTPAPPKPSSPGATRVQKRRAAAGVKRVVPPVDLVRSPARRLVKSYLRWFIIGIAVSLIAYAGGKGALANLQMPKFKFSVDTVAAKATLASVGVWMRHRWGDFKRISQRPRSLQGSTTGLVSELDRVKEHLGHLEKGQQTHSRLLEKQSKSLEMISSSLAGALNDIQGHEGKIQEFIQEHQQLSQLYQALKQQDVAGRLGGLQGDLQKVRLELEDLGKVIPSAEDIERLIEKALKQFEMKNPNESHLKEYIDGLFNQTLPRKEDSEQLAYRKLEEALVSLQTKIPNQMATLKDEIADELAKGFASQFEERIRELSNQMALLRRALADAQDEQRIDRIVNERVKPLLSIQNIVIEDSHILPDLALESSGARVVLSETSPTYRKDGQEEKPLAADGSGSLLGRLVRLSKTASKVGMINIAAVGRPPSTALHPDMSLGNCWAFAGSTGKLTIELVEARLIGSFEIEHVPANLVLDRTSAPRHLQVWMREEGGNVEGWQMVAQYEYRLDGPAAQRFRPDGGERRGKFVQLRVLDNHGKAAYTCLYRFKVFPSSTLL